VAQASSNGSTFSEVLGICYQDQAPGGTVIPVEGLDIFFTASANSFFTQSVSGVVAGLTAGHTYSVGVCAEDHKNAVNGDAVVTIMLVET